MKINRDVLRGAIEKWGREKQLMMLEEESIELSLATHKFLRNPGVKRLEDLIGEVADVHIMLDQFHLMYPETKEKVQEVIDFKLQRLSDRLDKNLFE